MNIIAVIQARMGSARLPGKSLLKVYKDYSLIELVLLRILKAGKINQVILATSDNPDCDDLAKVATKLKVDVIRGSEDDVLSRFVKAVELYKPDAVVRICADNPLVSFEEIDHLVDFFVGSDYDYAENNSFESGLPDGLGAEIVKADILPDIAQFATPEQKEHVTEYIIDNPDRYKIGKLKVDSDLIYPDMKLDIDTPADLAKMRKFCLTLPVKSAPYWTSQEIVNSYNQI